MSSQAKINSSTRVTFGPFEYDDGSGELRKHGVRLRLQGQPLQILSALLAQPSQIVSRERFQQQLWNGSTFVDFEHGLNAAVNRLRQVLGDSADQPRYIETMPSRGYRFIAPVRVVSPATMPSIAPVGLPDSVRSGQTIVKPSVLLAMSAIAALGLLVGYLAGNRRLERPAQEPLTFSFAPPKGYVLEPATSRQSFALSPDGSKLAFTAMDASGLSSVFVRDFRTLEAIPVANTSGSHSVFWSEDQRHIYFTARGSLRRATLEGDSYQVVSDSPAIISSVVALPSGKLLLSGASGTFTVPSSGGALQASTESYRWAQMLPDGKHLLYTTFDPNIGRHRTRVARFGEPESVKDLLETDSRSVYTPSSVKPGTGYLLSVRAGNLLAHPFNPNTLRVTGEPVAVARRVYSFLNTGAADFSVAETGVLAYQKYVGRSQLAWVDRKGQVITRVGPVGVNLKYATVSPDGAHIATSIFDADRGVLDIWLIDTAGGASRRLHTGSGVSVFPVWSPDSKKLAYARGFSGAPPKLFIRGIGDDEPEEALPQDFFQIPTDWSKNGRFVAFTNTGSVQVENEMKGDVHLVDLEQKRKVIRLTSTPFHEASPAFSPDGKWLAFTSDESGRAEVYIQAFQAGDFPKVVGERFLVSRHGAASLRWKRDGTELFCLGADGRFYAIPVQLSTRPSIGTPVAMFEISLEARGAIHAPLGFDVSPDGSRFLVPIATTSEPSEIVVVRNWEAPLRR